MPSAPQFLAFSVPPPSVAVAPGAEAAPTRFPVRRIYCVGRNYLDHIREMREADERDPPFFFQKPSDCVVDDGATIAYPPDTQDYQHEVELVVAIGTGGTDIAPEAALAHVFGYAIGLDMTRRDRQRDARAAQLPWEMGKSFDQSAPCGPIHPAASVNHLARGRIALSVNGAPRQSGDLGAMIWHVPEIIARLSTQYRLAPGDLIYTGTPSGVGALLPGDVLVAEIERLGHITITIGPQEA